MGELARLLNEDGRTIEECPLEPVGLASLLKLIDDGTISGKIAKTVFEEMYRTGRSPYDIVQEKGLTQVSDTSAIEAVVKDLLTRHPGEVERFRSGEEKLLGFFVGQAMKAMKGKANPQMLNELVKKKLSP